ncbi:MAG: LamG-like jellyroll fold domain-containing protein [Alphaproteobacteria bacterium]|nr:LamG-like jellyroll fold domain-containing protein [Alphaproteobacteria bacterium]
MSSGDVTSPLSLQLAIVGIWLTLLCAPVMAAAETPKQKQFKPRLEANWRHGTERSILMTEAWVPLAQDSDRVFYGDVRLMGDDGDNREWNFGAGYRQMSDSGDAVLGVHGWLDRRRSSRGSVFYQTTAGFEYLTEGLDIRLNAYVPANQKERYAIAAASTTPYLADTGIYYDTGGLLVEKPLHGFDIEFALPIEALRGPMESFRVAAGGFAFKGSDVEGLQGIRLRAIAEVTQDVQLGARFETDNQRGAQGFVEATLRFPFGSKSSAKTLGLKSRMDESPERDIDVITAARVAVAPIIGNPVLSAFDSMNQRVFHVDNTAGAGGDGGRETPFNTLTAAGVAADREGDIIYVHAGTGDSAGMQEGIVLAQSNQALIGSGTNFIYDAGRFTTSDGANFSGQMLLESTSAPVITNLNANGDGIYVTGSDVTVAGLTVDGAARHGLYAYAAGGADLGTLNLRSLSLVNNGSDGLRIEAAGLNSYIDANVNNLRIDDNRNGLRFYARQDGALAGAVTASRMTGNTQHGVILYDDSTAGSVDIDLGGGGRSDGGNSLYGNGLEDVAVDLDGATLMARGNWWGQAGGLYQSTPSGGLTPQIYYGAPLHDGLLLHWTFDSEWTSNTLAYDRSGNGYNGTLTGGLDLADMTSGLHREALNFNGTSEYVRTTALPGTYTQYTVLASVAPDRTTGGTADQNLYGFTVWSDGRPMGAPAPYPGWVTVRNGEVVARTYNTSNVGTATVGAAIGNAEWSQTAVSSIKGGQSNIYVDGALMSSFANPGNSADWIGGNFYVGELRAGRGLYYDGLIDDVRIYTRILSVAEVAEISRMNTSSIVDRGDFLTTAP